MIKHDIRRILERILSVSKLIIMMTLPVTMDRSNKEGCIFIVSGANHGEIGGPYMD